jgi:4a-hydroxytetrahydrobiopterin dehydratase
MSKKLSSAEIDAALQSLAGWKLTAAGKIEREFAFKSFPEAFSFMARIAFDAEQMGHHPDWFNSYNRVRIELTTHDAGGVTDQDIELARRIDKINWS